MSRWSITRLIALAAVLLVVTGCAFGAPPQPRGEASSDPSALVGVWRVSDAAGAGPDTWLRLGDEVVVWSNCGVAYGSWVARGSAVLVGIDSWDDDFCVWGRFVDPNPWLTAAVGYRETGEGMALLDSGGAVVATLAIDGEPPTSERYIDEYTQQPTETIRFDEPGRLPDGVSAAKEIVGRWIDPEHPDDGTYIEFSGDGSWKGSDGCNTSGGRYSYAFDGSLLATTGLMTLMGCEGSAIAELATSASLVGSSGDGISFYAADGTITISAVRG